MARGVPRGLSGDRASQAWSAGAPAHVREPHSGVFLRHPRQVRESAKPTKSGVSDVVPQEKLRLLAARGGPKEGGKLIHNFDDRPM